MVVVEEEGEEEEEEEEKRWCFHWFGLRWRRVMMASGEITRCPLDFFTVQPYNKGGRLSLCWMLCVYSGEGAASVTCRLESRHGLLTSASFYLLSVTAAASAANLLLLLHLLLFLFHSPNPPTSPTVRESLSLFFPKLFRLSSLLFIPSTNQESTLRLKNNKKTKMKSCAHLLLIFF